MSSFVAIPRTEDGILLYLFSVLGTTNRRVVEICAGDGIECNAANLIINHGWQGLLFDGDAAQVASGTSFYSNCRTTWVSPPTFLNTWVTVDNINGLIAGPGFSAQIDLLSRRRRQRLLDLAGLDVR